VRLPSVDGGGEKKGEEEGGKRAKKKCELRGKRPGVRKKDHLSTRVFEGKTRRKNGGWEKKGRREDLR